MRAGSQIKYQNRFRTEVTLTPDQEDLIAEMFFGPYKKEWKNLNGIVDNRDSIIAERIGVSISLVCTYTDRISREHMKNVLKLRK